MTIKNDERAQSMTQLKFISFQPNQAANKKTNKKNLMQQ